MLLSVFEISNLTVARRIIYEKLNRKLAIYDIKSSIHF